MSNQKVDFLIIGQGLSGSILAYKLIKSGYSICIIDNNLHQAASSIGNGIIAPITGTRFAKTWPDPKIQDSAIKFYKSLEKEFSTSLIKEKTICRFIYNDTEYEHYQRKLKKEEFKEFFKSPFSKNSIHKGFNHSYGGFYLNNCYTVCISMLLSKLESFLSKRIEYKKEKIDYQLLLDSIKHKPLISNRIPYKNIRAKNIIFCEGHQITQNPFFNTLPFRHVKGEALDINCSSLEDDTIYSNGKWLLPLGKHKFVFGATYDRHDMTHETTEHAKNRLTRLLSEFLKHPFTITGHRIGIRPSTTDFRPIIGPHPDFKQLYIFNGFGSKGLSLIPELAHQFSLLLKENKPLAANISLSRYYHLIKTKKTA